MTLLRIGRSIVDNNIDFFETCPMVHLLTKIPVPFSFPGKNVTLMYPTPLILAVYLNRPEIVQFLLEHENDPDVIHKPTILFLLYLWIIRSSHCRTC
ncbi:hypothetical protein M9Y10_041042 [Tritrichomonas musculus]|uniref:Ankyrin repeat protein n=1 Tax=Tritrichomonas musculus TaxID=1915356 RepID=A0ABR2K3B1_9EUKA